MTRWKKWALAWLSGEDRSVEAARAAWAGDAAARARAAAESAEWAAVYAAYAAEWAAVYAARYAARETPHSVDILSCARRAMS